MTNAEVRCANVIARLEALPGAVIVPPTLYIHRLRINGMPVGIERRGVRCTNLYVPPPSRERAGCSPRPQELD